MKTRYAILLFTLFFNQLYTSYFGDHWFAPSCWQELVLDTACLGLISLSFCTYRWLDR